MRKTATFVVEADNRDRGKVFLLTEMSASQAERWAARALMAMAKSNLHIPDNIADAGLAAIAALGFKAMAGMNFFEAEPLLEEMMTCVQIQPDPKHPQVVRGLVESDIEEVSTRFTLRKEVFQLITGFSLAAVTSSISQSLATAGNTSNTRTSRGRSERRSRAA